MKQILLSIALVLSLFVLRAQDEGLPDKLAQKPAGKDLPVKLLREDCNFIYYTVQRGGAEMKLEWSKAIITYGNESPLLTQARDLLSGDVPNYVSAKNTLEKVLADRTLPKWQSDFALYHIGLCHLGMGELDKAKEKFTSIKNDSRWYYTAKMNMVDTLPEDQKVEAIKALLNGSEITGPFKIELNFRLVDRYVADMKGADAKQAFENLKKAVPSPDKQTLIKFDEYQIKIDVMNKNYGDAEKKINANIAAGTETGIMRIALGDVYLSKDLKIEAIFEYLRGRLDFEDVAGEAGYKAGKLFSEMWQADKINFADYRSYASKELYISLKAGDSVWSVKSKKLIDQLKL